MDKHESGQVATTAAEVYDQYFVPALFSESPPHVLERAGVQAGERVLDVACGTGVLACEAKRLVGDSGQVVGLDINEGMLDMARSKTKSIEWTLGAAEDLPFDSNTFDSVVSQFGLMFFQNRTKALQEMLRVVHDGRRVCAAVWASLDLTPGYCVMAEMLRDLFGTEVAKSVEAPYCLGNPVVFDCLIQSAGGRNIDIHPVAATARFPSIESWIYTDIKGWTLADSIDEAQYERIQQYAPQYLSPFVEEDGSIAFETPVLIATFTA